MILTQMINEVLRDHSSVPFIPRKAAKNTKYKCKFQNCCRLKLCHIFLMLDNHPQTLTICIEIGIHKACHSLSL
jgi:hypothetical protein